MKQTILAPFLYSKYLFQKRKSYDNVFVVIAYKNGLLKRKMCKSLEFTLQKTIY